MKKLFIFLALRNIFRNKRRTALTIMVIVSGVSSYIIYGGFVKYTLWGLRESTIRGEIGHIQIYKKGYLKEGLVEPFKYLIEDYQKLKRLFYSLEHVEEVSLSLSFSGLISTGENTLVCRVFGQTKRKEQASTFATLVEGKDISELLDDDYCCVIGSELKKALKVNIGDNVTLLTTNVFGVIDALDLKVVGVCQSGSQEYDQVVVKIPLKIAQRILFTNSAEKIILYLDETENTSKVINSLEKLIKKERLDVEYKDWQQLAIFYQRVKDFYQGILRVIKSIILVIIFFSIANTQLMSVLERVREIATLRAIGTRKSQIICLFLIEGLWIGVIGGILGIIMGIFIANLINLAGGIYIPPPPGRTEGYMAMIFISSKALISAFIFSLVVCLLSSLFPAIKGAKLNIAEGLRYV